MKIFIFKNKYWLVGLFWIVFWQIVSLIIKNEILVVSPINVFKTLFSLLNEGAFWLAIGNTFYKIMLGFLLAFILAFLLAVVAYKESFIEVLLAPLMSVLKGVPVASYIILLLVLLRNQSLLALITSFIMVLPIFYTNILRGLENIDKSLLEMAYIFKISKSKKIIYIYLASLLPFIIAASQIALGLCWKAGVAAEVIGLVNDTIGSKLYYAKLYLNIQELFAWTIVIICISMLFEKSILGMLNLLRKRIEQ